MELMNKERDNPGFLYNLLKEIDPIKADKIYPSDLRRILRALEVFLRKKADK